MDGNTLLYFNNHIVLLAIKVQLNNIYSVMVNVYETLKYFINNQAFQVKNISV